MALLRAGDRAHDRSRVTGDKNESVVESPQQKNGPAVPFALATRHDRAFLFAAGTWPRPQDVRDSP